jgi:hypothetical protein
LLAIERRGDHPGSGSWPLSALCRG